MHLPLDKYKNASVIEDEQNGYRYYFTKGIMTQWEPLDGLNKWAKEGKENNPSIFYAMYNAAQQYWGSDEVAAIKEVNEQYDSSASIPIDIFKKYINYYREPEGFFNYRLCMSAHCERSLTLRELKDFSHNKCTYLQSISGNEAKMFYVYKYQYTLYCFDEGGNLVNAKLVE